LELHHKDGNADNNLLDNLLLHLSKLPCFHISLQRGCERKEHMQANSAQKAVCGRFKLLSAP
jgi:hypothetical protein